MKAAEAHVSIIKLLGEIQRYTRRMFRLTSRISFAFVVDRLFNTRSTALAVFWFWNLSRIVAAVISKTKMVIAD
jgi:hypothetical protein